MTDKRASQRQRTFKAGSIVFNYAAGIDCIVKNRSAVGAMIEVESQLGVPDSFVLVIDCDKVRQPCSVVWRKGNRIGVEFG
jgi:PilZ domain